MTRISVYESGYDRALFQGEVPIVPRIGESIVLPGIAPYHFLLVINIIHRVGTGRTDIICERRNL